MIDSVNLKTTQLTSDAIDSVSKSRRQVADVSQVKSDDRVSISDSAKLAIAIQQEAQIIPEDMERIRQLQTAIQSGSYQVDSRKIADSLIREARES